MTHTPKTPPKPAWWLVLLVVLLPILGLIVGVWAAPTLNAGWQRLQAPAAGAAVERAESEDTGTTTWYISQMHPWIVQPEPGTCPICGMDLTPVDPERFAGEISIDPVTVQNIGIRTATARRESLTRRIRTLGIVRPDPQHVRAITLRAQGWAERLHVTAVGDRVEAMQPLVAIRSPGLYAAQREYLIAWQRGDQDATDAAATKLRYLGHPDIERLAERGEAEEVVLYRAQDDGFVTAIDIAPGAPISPNEPLLRVADLSQLWIEVDIYENQLGDIHYGMPIRVVLADGTTIDAELDELEPVLDPVTRTARARVRLEVPENADADPILLPGQYATVDLLVPTSETLVVPQEAVVDTGERSIVFISQGQGRFEPRTVETGATGNDGMIAISSGLEVGERVVVSGQFLLDSESRMKEALAKMMQGDLATQEPSDPTAAAESNVAGGDMPIASAADAPHLAALLDAAQQVWNTAFHNRQPGADTLSATIANWLQDEPHAHHQYPALEEVRSAVSTLNTAEDLPAARSVLDELGLALKNLLAQTGRPPDRTPWLYHCGMAPTPHKGWWLQNDSVPRNPYFGQTNVMRSCATEAEHLR